ncbi:hypothetical protein SAMN05444156_0606 [Verrucomicrobium sp. GAS474]|uniref:hypothetical protein n=1 Tax=Verrucomicrobium sp. GAS474 TaxID=1882831 RepID=UPI0008798477|nr:hypothetical protein [Verrucomicrobium sp. GAS474]SDT90498.1 hypothetical protein SAMN05444156_0606 [Verrucomicrobium sp. GAS474]
MKAPGELAYPDTLPDDLKVILAAQKVPSDDPLLAVLAWHWGRINQSNDALQETGMVLKVALDERIKVIAGSVKALEEVARHLDVMNGLLSEKPSVLGKQIEAELTRHIGSALSATQGIAGVLSSLFQKTEGSFRRLHRERFAAAFLSGLASGALLIPWTYSHFFSH